MLPLHDEFPQLEGLRYLNHAAVSPWPRRTATAVAAFAEENATLGARDYPRWTAVEQRLRQRLARLINASSSDDIALVKSTSEALSFVASGLDWRPGDRVVIREGEFPSNRIVWEALRARGVETVSVSLQGSDPEGDLLRACESGVRLLAISAVQFDTGLRLDLERLGEGCRRLGILFCVDAIQQIGALPFDVQACQCHFAMADGHKWMMAPEGMGVFYCHPDWRERLALTQYGWHMLESVGDYGRADWRPASSGRRFECGSPNNLGVVGLDASLSLIEEMGIEAIASALAERVEWLAEGLLHVPGIRIHSPTSARQRSGILSFSLESASSETVFQRMTREQVVCSLRGPGVRLSPHFYTRVEVIDATLELIHGIARS